MKKTVTTCLTLPAIAVLLAASASSAHADYSANATAGAYANMHAGTIADAPANVSLSSSNPWQPLQAINQASILDPNLALTESAGGSGSAWVEPGALHLTASGTAFVQGSGPDAYDPGGASGYGYASGGFSETTVWNVSGVAAGSVVTVDFQIRIDGATGVNMVLLQGGTASGYRIYDWDLRFAGVGYHSVTNSDQVDNFGILSFSTQVTVGAPVTLSISGSVAGQGKAGVLCSSFWGYACDPYTHGASVTGFADLGHTLSWNGVTGLHLGDADLPLAALSVTSDSGFDYSQAYVAVVPEPSSFALLAAGLLLLLPRLRARARMGVREAVLRGLKNQHRAVPFLSFTLASLLALMPGPAAAQYTASSSAHSDVNATTSYSAAAGAVKDASSNVGSPVASDAHSVNADNIWQSLTGEDWSRAGATVSGGALHLSAVSEAISRSTQVCGGCLGGAGAIAHASAAASFSDMAVLGVAGLATGTTVQATFLINVDGSLDAHATGNLSGSQVASVNWTFWLNGVHYDANGGYGYQLWIDAGSVRDNSAASMPSMVVMQTTLTVGQSFGISMAASVNSQAAAQTGINARPVGYVDDSGGVGTASFANTFAWGGLVGLTDMSGNALDLSLASATSASGFDYTEAYVSPVPESSSALLMLAGLLALPWLHSRRRKE